MFTYKRPVEFDILRFARQISSARDRENCGEFPRRRVNDGFTRSAVVHRPPRGRYADHHNNV